MQEMRDNTRSGDWLAVPAMPKMRKLPVRCEVMMRLDYISYPKTYLEQLEVQKHQWFYKQVNKKIKKNQFVLDFGVGGGYGIREITRTKNLFATDINEKNKKNAPENAKWIDYWRVWGRQVKFDAIILCHVIEHMKKPRRELHYLMELLKKNGRLFIATPNASFRGTTKKPFNHHHVREYTWYTLSSLFGHKLQKISGITTTPEVLKKVQDDNRRKHLLSKIDFLMLRRFISTRRKSHPYDEEFSFEESTGFKRCLDVTAEIRA